MRRNKNFHSSVKSESTKVEWEVLPNLFSIHQQTEERLSGHAINSWFWLPGNSQAAEGRVAGDSQSSSQTRARPSVAWGILPVQKENKFNHKPQNTQK